MNLFKHIPTNWFFSQIESERLSAFLADGSCRIRSYSKGEVIHHYTEDCTSLEIIISGRITVNRYDSEGNIVHISTLPTGETIGGILLYASVGQYPFEVSALDNAQILEIPADLLLSLLSENPSMLKSFLKDISDKSILLTSTIHTLSEKALRQKILQYLYLEVQNQQSAIIVLPHTKKLLAERFGVARTSLSRELKTMQDEGLILVNGQQITLLLNDQNAKINSIND